MATRGISFDSPPVVNPFGFDSAEIRVGRTQNDMASLAMMGAQGVQLARQNQAPTTPLKGPSIAYSPSRNEFFVQGTTFAGDDAQSLLEAQKLLGGPPTGLPTDGDWTPLDAQSYGQLIQNVKNPSLGTLAARNFGRGVDQAQMLAGRGLQFLGAEKLGEQIVSQQMADLRKTTPYERQFTDIESGRGAIEWLVANFAQQGPNLIESVATAGAGFLAGTAASGTPLGGAAAALSSLIGKETWKQSVKAVLAKQARGEALKGAEQKLLREAAGIAGAVAASYAQNVATGVADIYGEMREQGVDASDMDARLKALAGSVPYAVLETLPEFVLAGRVLHGVGAPKPIAAGTSLPRRGLELLRRGAIGFGVGGTAEGTTELGQDALIMGLTDQDLGSKEGVNRLINAFAAGFGIGGPLGAVANLRGKDPANLLDSSKTVEPSKPSGALAVIPPPQPPGPGTAVAPYYTPVQPMGAMPTPPELLAGAPNVPQLPGPAQPITPMGGPVIMAGMGPNAADVTRRDILLQQQGNVPPGATLGSQGVLDIFGGAIPAQELAARMQPQQPLPGLPMPGPGAPDARQGVLQFAPAAPGIAPTAIGAALEQAQRAQQMQQMQQMQQQQLAAQRQADLDRLGNIASAQRQLDFAAQQATPASAPLPMPMVPAGPVQPQQLPLFTRRQAPVPPKAGQLRRGGKMQPAVAPIEVPLTAAQRRAQLPLITQEGQPSMAALKSAGTKTKVAVPVPPTPVVRPRGQRGLKKQAGVAAVEVTRPVRETKTTYRVTYKGKPATVTISRTVENPDQIAGVTVKVDGERLAAVNFGKQGVVSDQKLIDDLVETEIIDAKGEPSATQKGNLKRGRVAERAQDNEGIRAGGQVGNQPSAQVPTGGAQAGGGGKPVVGGAKPEKVTTPTTVVPVQPSPQFAATVRQGELARAASRWREYASRETQPKWSELSDAQKEAWRKVAIEDNKPSMAAAEEIAPPKKEKPPVPKVEAASAAVTPSVAPEAPTSLTLERSDGTKVTVKDGKKYQAKLDADIKKYEALLACLVAAR